MSKPTMKRLLKNIRIISPYSDPEYIEDGYIVIKDDMIESIESTPPRDNFDDVVDLRGKTVIPGMINAHTHLYSALALGMPSPTDPPKNFVEILKNIWWKLDLALDEDSSLASFESGLLDSLRWGVTTIFDHHSSQNFIPGSLNILAKTAEHFGVNISVAFEISDRNGEDRFLQGLEENLSSLNEFADSPYIHPMVGLHASFTLSDQSLKNVRKALDKFTTWGIHIHVAEDQADQKDALSRGYHSVIQRLHHFGLLNSRSLIIHGVHMIPEDIALIKETGAFLVHNPTSNANNRVGITSGEFINSLRSGLGTDGMQANMLAEAKEGTLIRSSHLPGGLDNVNYLELLFKNNSEIATYLFGRKMGKIETGYLADLAIYDYYPRTELNVSNYWGHILFGFEKPSDVMTRGEFRIKDFKFLFLKEEETNANAKKQSVRLWNTMKNL